MKNLFKFLPMFAIVAGIAFSAFTSANHVVQNKPLATYFWYEVDADGHVTSETLNPLGEVDKNAAMSLAPADCADTPAKDFCVLGSSSDDLQIDDQITSPPTDAIIRRTN